MLNKIDLPDSLRNTHISDLDKATAQKCDTVHKLMNSTRTFFITGSMSLNKDRFISALINLLDADGRVLSYVTHTFTGDYPIGAVCFIVNIELIPSRQGEHIKSLIADKFQRGGVVIISCNSLDSFKEKFGDDVFKYISNSALEITIQSTDNIIARI